MTSVQFGAVLKVPMSQEVVSQFKTQEYIGEGVAGFVQGTDLFVTTGPKVEDGEDGVSYKAATEVVESLSGLKDVQDRRDQDLRLLSLSLRLGLKSGEERHEREAQYRSELEACQAVVDAAKEYIKKFFIRRAEGSQWL